MTLPLQATDAPPTRRPTAPPALSDVGMARRLGRLMAEDGNVVIVGFDHGVSHGALPGLERLPELAELCVTAGADALQVSAGGARWLAATLARHPGTELVLRLDRSSFVDGSSDPPVSAPVAGVRDALRAGAQAAAVFYLEHVANAGVANRHAAVVGAIASECRGEAMPLIVEAIPAGERDPLAVIRVARTAFELGADLLKVDHPGDEGALSELTSAVGAPVLLRGGPPSDDLPATLRTLERAIELGVRGVVIGRTVWQSPEPATVLGEIQRAVHGM